MSAKDRLSLAIVAAVLAGGVALTPLTKDRTFLVFAAAMLAASAAIGAVARRLVASELVVRLFQLAPLVLLPVLVPATRRPIDLAAETVRYLQDGVAPLRFHTGFAVLCVLLLWLCYLVAESLAVGWGAPAWTFVPIFLPFFISGQLAYLEVPAWKFALAAGGYALILATAARGVLAEGRSHGWFGVAAGRRNGATVAAALSTVAAIAFSLLAGVAVPDRPINLNLGGSGPVELTDPSLDLIRNLNSTSNQPVLTYQTTAEGGQYLRMAALPVLDDTGFHLAATELSPLPVVEPKPVSGSHAVTTVVSVGEFASEYLPVPWIPGRLDAPGDWRWDPQSLAVVAVGDGRRTATRRMNYQVASRELPSLERLAAEPAEPGTEDFSRMTLEVPSGLSPEAEGLVELLTKDAATPAAKTLAIRDYLRSDDFTYSTASVAATTMDSLNDFLFGSRSGYCEQFAGGMAVLARVAGIPSRVVIGFLPGRQTDDGWEVTARNMHAWTEVYLGSALGWVAVDATPPGAVGVAPSTVSPSATPSTAAPTSASPKATPTVSASAKPRTSDDDVELPGWLGLGLLGLLVVAAIAVGPNLVRWTQRRQRLSGTGQVWEDAWDELHALAGDLGAPWPEGSSRSVATQLGAELDAASAAALAALAEGVERSRFAPPGPESGGPTPDVTALVRTIELGMQKRWQAPTSWLDRWWPRSLWPRGR